MSCAGFEFCEPERERTSRFKPPAVVAIVVIVVVVVIGGVGEDVPLIRPGSHRGPSLREGSGRYSQRTDRRIVRKSLVFLNQTALNHIKPFNTGRFLTLCVCV